jgi:hypothetical protein
MPRFAVTIVEARELIYEIEAEDAAEAEQIAMDEDTTEAVRDSFRERWCDGVDEL